MTDDMELIGKDLENNHSEENENEEQKPERPVNPNSFIPVMDDMLLTFGQIYYDKKMEIIQDNKEVYNCTLLGVLFSAGWSSPCRLFYKDLIDIYKKMNDGEKIFEIIQISFDEKEEDFKNSIADLPWKFLPLNFEGKNKLKEKYNVLTIPKFFPVDKTGKALSDRGREDLLEYGVDICEKWNEDARVCEDLIWEEPIGVANDNIDDKKE